MSGNLLGDEKDTGIEMVRWVWIALNFVLVMYALFLFIYAKYWRKKEILATVRIFIADFFRKIYWLKGHRMQRN
jgi:hypothetical protein